MLHKASISTLSSRRYSCIIRRNSIGGWLRINIATKSSTTTIPMLLNIAMAIAMITSWLRSVAWIIAKEVPYSLLNIMTLQWQSKKTSMRLQLAPKCNICREYNSREAQKNWSMNHSREISVYFMSTRTNLNSPITLALLRLGSEKRINTKRWGIGRQAKGWKTNKMIIRNFIN